MNILKELEIKFIEFDQDQWNDYLFNILYNKPFFPRLPESETSPTLVLLSLYNILWEIGIDIKLFKNAIKFNYDKIKSNSISINDYDALEAIISITGVSINISMNLSDKVDYNLVLEFKTDYNQGLLKNCTVPSTGRNLHDLLKKVIRN